jgi:hypothetical protein
VLSDVLDWKTNERFDLVIAIGFWDYRRPVAQITGDPRSSQATFLSAWPRAATLRAAIHWNAP